jgi:hypothetical protein
MEPAASMPKKVPGTLFQDKNLSRKLVPGTNRHFMGNEEFLPLSRKSRMSFCSQVLS